MASTGTLQKPENSQFERQWAEAEAIRSIYLGEFEEVKFPWKTDHPPQYILHLSDQDREGNALLVDLNIKIVAGYPDSKAPELQVTKRKGLTPAQQQSLQTVLEAKASSLVGQEMIFDLVEEAKAQLNKMATKKVSFHAEMVGRRAADVEAKKAIDSRITEAEEGKRRLLEEELEAKIQEEVERKRKQMEEEPQDQTVDDNDDASILLPQATSHRITFDPLHPVKFLTHGTTIALEWIDVMPAEPAEQFWLFGQVHRATSMEGSDPVLLTALHTRFMGQFYRNAHGKRKLEALCKTLRETAETLPEYPGLVRVLGSKLELGENWVDLWIVADPIGSTSRITRLDHVLSMAGTIGLEKSVGYLKGLVDIIGHLHSHGIIHKDIVASNILVLGSASRFTLLFPLLSRILTDLHQTHPISSFISLPEAEPWMRPPEAISKNPAAIGRKADIWQVGVLAVMMIIGRPDQFESVDQILADSSISPSELLSFLQAVLNKDPSKRPAASELAQHQWFTKTISKPALTMSKRALSHTSVHKPAVTSSNEPYSRYRSDFEEIQFLGKGAFGAVIKVRNRIDNRFYAVKRIKLDPRDPEENQKILREVTTISRLHHDRITRYYQAWIEGDMSGVTVTSAPSSRHQSKSRSKDYDDDSTEEHDEFSDANTFGREDWLGFEHTIDTAPHQSFSSLLDLSINHTGFSEPETHDDSENGSPQATESWDPAKEIQFQRDSNDNENGEEGSLLSDEYSSSESRKVDPSKQLFLYIQMEYCPNQTLRDVIDEGGLDMAEVWRLFRQVLEGLAYIHGQGMIHRDLKPSNIFLDSNGDIKIGDFGLAVVDSPATHQADAPPKPVEDKERLSLAGLSLTGAVGTPFYMSPEQEKPGTSRYSHRVDMYALGIIFVELCCGQFATAMERVVMLRAVRSPSITLPPVFDKPDMAQPKAIAKSLLSHNPKDRMDASVLLARPDLVPPKMEDEAVNEAIRSLSSPGSPHYPKLVRAVFAQQSSEAAAFKDFTFDMHSGLITDVSMLKRITQIKAALARLFETHGAIEFPTPLLNLPKTASAPDSVRLLDSHGSLVTLPGNLVEPFARFVSHNRLGELKRFVFDRTFRSNPAGGQPLHFLEAAFDICFPLADDSSIHGAHAIKVAMDAVTRTCEIDDVTIHLSHRKLVDVLGRMVGVAEGKRNHFYNLLVTKKTSWTKHKQILSAQLGIPVLAFEQLTPFSRPLAFQKASSLLKQEADSLALLTSIGRLVERLEVLGIDGKHVLLDLMAGSEPGCPYSGLTFQIYPATGLHRENSSPLIIGGHYDHLLASYSYPHLTNMGAVGFTVPLPKLALYLPQTPSLVDVLVYSTGDSEDTLLAEKLSILAELWASNIHADLLPSSAKPSQEHLIRIGKRMGVSVMVLVKEQHQSGGKGKIVKVKDLERRSECEVQRSDLVETLLKMHNQQPEQAPSQTLLLSTGIATQQRESMFRVHLLTSSATITKMKPSQRSAISERAIKALSPLLPALAKPIEIIAHDLSSALVDIAVGSGSEDAAKAGEREAVTRMKAQLKLLRDRGDQLVALFNYKEGSVQIIPLFIIANNH